MSGKKKDRERLPSLFDLAIEAVESEGGPLHVEEIIEEIEGTQEGFSGMRDNSEPFVPLRDRPSVPLPPVAPPVFKQVEAEKPADAPSDVAMDPTALVFLDDPIARKLAVAWRLGARSGISMSEDDWLRVSGLEHSMDAKRLCRMLRANNICRDGGATDELALRYIATIVAAPLKKAVQKSKES